jgi:outer membrane protein TolC
MVLVSRAQEPIKLSLDDAIRMALKNNTDILNSQLDLKIAQKKIWETTATGLPHFDAKGTYQHLFKVPTISFPSIELSKTKIPYDETTGTGTTSELTLSDGENIYLNSVAGDEIELSVKNYTTFDFTVSQLIFNGAYFIGLQASKTYYALSKQNDEKTKLDVTETVVNTYHMIQLGEESRKILSQNLENINKTVYEVSEMHKQGFLERTDVDQLEVTANTVRNAMNQIDSNLDVAYRLLKIQLGMEDTARIELTDKTESNEALTKSSLELIYEPFGLERNVDYQLAKTAVQLAKLDYKREQTGFLPVITGFYNHTEKLKTPAFDFTPKDMIGINLSLPIFSSGQRLALVSQKKMAFDKAENTRQLVSRSLTMQASQYQNDLKLKLEKLLIQEKNKELSEDIYQRTLEKYKLGVASSMDLMNSHNQYLSNLTNYYQSVYDLLGSKSKLEKLFNINREVTN